MKAETVCRPVAGISEVAVQWPDLSAEMRRPGAGKAEILEAQPL